MIEELAQRLIGDAWQKGAQDLYILPLGSAYQIFIRVKDQRYFLEDLDAEKSQALIGHFKFRAGMNVGEKRRKQLGSCSYPLGEQAVSLRLSTVGDYRARESLVIRLLHDQTRELKFWFRDLEDLAQQVSPRGLYLFAGPVGSGKTSLMHALAISQFGQEQLMSIEDPVEIRNDQILQLQVNQAIDLTYDQLIKLSLRHRPDLLIIGEIRDRETARAALRASLTGIRVFSTIHAKSIPGVIERLLELGISKEEIKHSLAGVAYQRLIAGGGVIDFVSENFEDHKADQWNQEIDQLVAAGHLTVQKGEEEKIKD